MHKYMFSAENILRYTKSEIVDSSKAISKPIVKKSKPAEFFFPSETDQLFWCFYIIINGQDKYDMIKNSIFKTEKEFKIESVEKLRFKKDILKINKLKKTEVENQLVNIQCIKLEALRALCILYEISIIYVTEQTYSLFNYGSDISAIIIKTNNKYGFRLNNIKQYVEDIKSKYFYIEDRLKPIKGIASYTIKELQSIAIKLDISLIDTTGKKIVKKALYETILTKL